MTKSEHHRAHHVRFTAAERLAFGQRPFVSAAQRRFGGTHGSSWNDVSADGFRPFSKTSSEPAFMPDEVKEKLTHLNAQKSDFLLPPLTKAIPLADVSVSEAFPKPSPQKVSKSPWQTRTGFLIGGGTPCAPLEEESPVRRVISRIYPTETPKVSPAKRRQLHGSNSPCRSPGKRSPCRSPGKRLTISSTESPTASRTMAGRKPKISLDTPASHCGATPGPLSRVQEWAQTPGNGVTPSSAVSLTSFLQSNTPESMPSESTGKTPKQTPNGSQKHAQRTLTRLSSSMTSFSGMSPTAADRGTTPSLKRGPPSATPMRSRRELIEVFRKRLLEKYKSVHDAFMEIEADDSKDQLLTFKEFRKALRKLKLGDIDSRALFEAMDQDNSGEVTLTEFLVALVDVSPETLLWELRCRLESQHIRPDNLTKVWELISSEDDDQQKSRKKINLGTAAKAAALLAEAEKDPEEAEERRNRSRLTRAEWLKFGSSLGLAINEIERLFGLIDSDRSGSVELSEMFAALRAVAPDVSLERFVTKVLRQYRTLPEAFKAHADAARRIGFEEFKSLAAQVDVNDKNAKELWEARDIGPVARLPGDSLTSSLDQNEHITEEEFVRQMLAWSPDTALDRLRESLSEQFGSVAQGKRALIKAGVPKTAALTTEVFNAGLQKAGVRHCDGALILSTVASYRRKGDARGSPCHRGSSVDSLKIHGVTLDEVIAALRATSREGSRNDPQRAGSLARAAVGSDLGPYWQQLKALKNDVRRGLDGSHTIVSRTAAGHELQYGETGDRVFNAVSNAVKQLAVGNAQNLALKGMNKFRQKTKERRSKSEPQAQDKKTSLV
eukprot:gnl/MRDRNA2_/MRDRNA2_108982_c0_seq1.p1 gnl/MRDRNA2_/MRDRNA2_108982_c0~~gnl/MRDRNA2_/MRDRNA2_108982_c0_seq1.p1  ORF type:complete len:837 (+),score=172.22 gnl/MRDRNA2_/MRDRNA2_108982_c0_seq1:87-2597(+)